MSSILSQILRNQENANGASSRKAATIAGGGGLKSGRLNAGNSTAPPVKRGLQMLDANKVNAQPTPHFGAPKGGGKLGASQPASKSISCNKTQLLAPTKETGHDEEIEQMHFCNDEKDDFCDFFTASNRIDDVIPQVVNTDCAALLSGLEWFYHEDKENMPPLDVAAQHSQEKVPLDFSLDDIPLFL